METVAREAATVVLMRDRSPEHGEPEVLLMRRHAKANFGAGAYVFPGGMLEAADYSPAMLNLVRGMTVEEAASEMQGVDPPEKALGLRVAALRETFEEAGVLLARREDGSEFHPTQEQAAALHHARTGADFAAVVQGLGLNLLVDQLVYIGHWITPVCRPIRFDTHFFLVSVTGRVEASPDRQEVMDEIWLTPSEALEQNKKGELRLMSPTMTNLEWLSVYGSTAETIEVLKEKPVQTILPKIIADSDGKEHIVHPWDKEYN